MNISVPKGIKSPTVIVIGGGTMSGDEKSNYKHEKRMDMLEKKLDQQYKNRTQGIDPKVYTRNIEQLQRSFMKKFDGFISESKQNITVQNNKLLEALRKKMNQKVQVIKESSNGEELKTFVKKIDSLEEAIKKVSLKTKIITPKANLDGAFEKLFAKMERLIKEAKPRVYPSPS